MSVVVILSSKYCVFTSIIEVVTVDYKVSLFEVRNPLLAIPDGDMPIFATTDRLKDYNITHLSLCLYCHLLKIEDRKNMFIAPRIASYV